MIDVIKYAVIGIALVLIGLRFILQHKKVVKAALTGQNIFARKIEDREIKRPPAIIKFNYIMVCLVGSFCFIIGLSLIIKAILIIAK